MTLHTNIIFQPYSASTNGILSILQHFRYPITFPFTKNIFSSNSNVHAKIINNIVGQCLKPAFIEGGRASIRAALTT